jgi:3-oxoacyl-[acyl-carrier-protein] synthase II
MTERIADKEPFITGLGMISCLGDSAHAAFRRMREEFRAASPLSVIDAAPIRLKCAYEISSRQATLDEELRATSWLIEAIRQEIADAKLQHMRNVPVLVGTGLRELQSFERWCAKGRRFHPADLHFKTAIRAAIPQAGEVITVSNACSAGNFALGLAFDLMAVENAPVAIAAGCDSLSASMFAFTDRAAQPGLRRVQPFDRNRRGVILGEGAAAVVLESRRHAAQRGGMLRARLRAVGMSCDAAHETAPDARGIAAAITDALMASKCEPADIDLVVAHGTGTSLNDPAEASAIRAVFGAHRPPVTAIKGHTGHTSGAAGLMGVITAVLTMEANRIPPISPAIEPIDEAADFDLVVGTERAAKTRCAMVNAFGFGGVNAVAVVDRPEHLQ